MSNIHKFVEKVKADATLKAKVTSLAADDVVGLLALASDTGYPFTVDEYNAYQTGELGDDQLGNVSGGGARIDKLPTSSTIVIRID
jgi:predicted ribosomally synthesized peptide with nif11-like leader